MNLKSYLLFVTLQLTTVAFAQIDLVKDINPGITVPGMDAAITYHGFIYYSNGELWRTDGTADGTSQVKDILPGRDTSAPLNFVIYNDQMYFSARDVNGRELWRSDGTAAGTVMVADINSGSGDSNPGGFVVANGKLFFRATTPANGKELWVTDGTGPGTSIVLDANPGPGDSLPSWSVDVTDVSFSDQLYFSADDGTPGAELWKTDGTAGGTSLVADVSQTVADTYVAFITVVNSKIFFGAHDGTAPALRIWISDGTTTGTQTLGNMTFYDPGTIEGNYLYFSGADGPSENWELWRTDGTLANTQFIADVNGDPAISSVPTNMTFVGSTLYFAARSTSDYSSKLALYKSTGEPGDFTMISNQFSDGYYPMNLRDYNGILTFAAKSGFYWYDGSTLKTEDVGFEGSAVSNIFAELNDVLYFSGLGLNRFDGTSVTRVGVPSNHNSNPSSFTDAGSGVIFFAADDGTNGMELWKTDGTGETSLVKDINPSGSSNPTQFRMYNGKVYFNANDGTHGIGLWKSDGTDGGTVLVLDVGMYGQLPPNGLIVHKGALYVSTGIALWKIENESPPQQISNAHVTGSTFTSTANDLYFMAFDPVALKCSLFKSDGTSAGTVPVTNNLAGCLGPSSDFSELVEFQSKIYFLGFGTSPQSELWSYDGTTSAPVRAYADGGPAQPGNFTIVGSTLFFGGADAIHGYELWKTDGTASNTTLVKDIKSGTNSSLFTAPSHGPPYGPLFRRIAFDDKLFFAADDGSHGRELWTSDGTEAGTVLLNDLVPGPSSGNATNFVTLDSSLYFLSWSDEDENEINPDGIYVTNGLSCGTRKIMSARYITQNAQALTAIGSKLYISLRDSRVGQEPFFIEPSLVPLPPEGCGTQPISPITQPTALVFSDVKNKGMTVSFTPSTKPGAGYITLMRAEQSPYPEATPVDGTTYQAGTTIGASLIVGAGTATTLVIKKLEPETTYYFDVFAYDSNYHYVTVNPLAGNQRTDKKDDPQIDSISFPAVTQNTITLAITPGDPQAGGYITLMNTSPGSADVPQDGSAYQIGNSVGGSVVVGFGTDTTLRVSSLQPGTEYFFNVFPYTKSGNSYDYLQAGSVSARQQTTGVTTEVVSSKEERVAYPNPFTDALTIPFYTSTDDSQVHVIIYDQVGRVVAEVVNSTFETGDHEVSWDRTDRHGNKVQAGMYLYQVKTREGVMQGLVVAK